MMSGFFYFRFLLLSFCVIVLMSNNVKCRYLSSQFHRVNEYEVRRRIQHDVIVNVMWVEQRLDHFSAQNRTTWMQRYFINNDYYGNHSNAPIFLMISGESEAINEWMINRPWINYAKQFGALCFLLEHRYYGESRPTGDLSMENLKYLTSQQALADLVTFIRAMKEEYNLAETQKWIAFGGSYAGSLAAWLRQKYPELVHGAISSSAPLLAKANFKEYYAIVKDSLAAHSLECFSAIGQAFSELNMLIRDRTGQYEINRAFNTCTPIENSVNNKMDISNFFATILCTFGNIVETNDITDVGSIAEACGVMINQTIGPPFERVAAIIKIRSPNKCLFYSYSKLITALRNVSWDGVGSSWRTWFYQLCNEFGFFSTAEDEFNVLRDHVNIDFYINHCLNIFSEKMDANHLHTAVNKTNTYYGAMHPNTTNVLYVHGSIDPWHALGLTNSKDPKTPTLYIKGTGHCANMNEPQEYDSSELVAARVQIVKYLANLLK